MSIRRSRGATRCPTCQRTKSEAIEEQVSRKKVCDCSTCIFRSDIQKAIDESTRIKIVKKDSPKINFRKKEHTISIKRKI